LFRGNECVGQALDLALEFLCFVVGENSHLGSGSGCWSWDEVGKKMRM
jgi:hypothetical protein